MAATLGAAGVWLVVRPGGVAPAARVTRFAITEPSLQSRGLAISRDGAQIAYMTGRGLVVRARDRLESRLVASSNLTQGSPFFSPDGQWVAFRGWEALRKVPATGGEARALVDQIFPSGTWIGQDIIFGDTRGLFRVSAAGGKPVRLATTEGVEQIVSVDALPERRAVLFTVIPTRGNADSDRMAANVPAARIESLDLRTGKRQVVLRGGGRPRYTKTGHLLYVSGGTLYAVPFDVDHLQTRGNAVPVVTAEGLLDYDVSTDGTLVYEVFSAGEGNVLVWADRSGHEQPLGAPTMWYLYPRISPDGKRVALDVSGNGARDVWIWDLQRATMELFTKNDPSGNPIVTWSPDGRELVFGSERSGVSNVYRQPADGSGEPQRMFESDAMQMPISYTPDGRLLVSVGVPGQQRDIYLATLNGRRHIEPLIHSPANELWAEVSPDGHWIAYDSDESGQFEVYVRPFPDAYAGGRWQVSTGGGRQSLWSHDGRELFYRDFSGALMSVPVTPGPQFKPGRPVKVLDGRGYSGAGAQGGGRTYDVAADGSRFLMVKPTEPAGSPQLVVVLNWFEELVRLAPIH
jgi:serine/threonine-protein kinase